MIEVRNLTKRYGKHVAVDNLNFTVQKGQIYGFLGPNGAGKSTTMNIITGYIGLSEGEVLVNGHDILDEPEKAKSFIGYLPEQPPLYGDMTVKEYLEFAAELKKLPKAGISNAIGEAMELTKVEDVKDRLIRNLSKGYRQRVGLAQAILGFPEIIILDEPTVGLDPKQIIEMRELIRSFAGEHTVILSSHILSEVQEICDHLLIIHRGRLIASGTPEKLEQQVRTAELELVVKSDDAGKVQAIFSGMPDIEKLSVREAENGEITVKLEPREDVDVREAVFYACADAGVPLLMMKNSGMSLETIFLELTSDKNGAAEKINFQSEEEKTDDGDL